MKKVQDRYGVFWYNDQEINHWQQADFDRKAADFAAAGINIVMTFSCTHFRWSFYPWWDKINAALAKVVKACHKYNIRVVEHHSSHLTHDPRSAAEWQVVENTFRTRRASLDVFPGLKEYISCGDPEILPGIHLSSCRQIDGRTGDFARTIYTGYGHCFNNPHYRQVYFKYLEDVYATGVDGIMTDDVQYFGSHNACACKFCREKFKYETGFDLPAPAAWGKFHGNYDDPVFIEWLRFRVRSTEDFHREVNAHFKKLGLDLLRPNYATTTFSCNLVAYPFEAAGDLWSCYFQENMFSSVIRTAWPNWHNIAEHRRSMGKKYNGPAMSMFYPARQDDYYFCWSLAKAWNHLLMASPEGGDINDVEQKYAAYTLQHPVLENADDLPDIGFFEPRSSLDLTAEPLKNIIWPMNVWLQGGSFRNLRFSILFEDDPLEELLKYPLIVLVGAVMLSDEQLELFRQYCELGGKLFIFGPFGLRDTDGSLREHPEETFGLNVETSSFTALEDGQFVYAQNAVPLPAVEEGLYFKRIGGASQILAQNGGDKITGISAMNGNLIWLLGGVRTRKPEDHYYDQRISRWTVKPGKMTATIGAADYIYHIPGGILKLLLGRSPRIECSSRDYLATVYRTQEKTAAEVHLVNVSGTLPEKGTEFSHDDLFINFLPGAEKNRSAVKIILDLPGTPADIQMFSPEFTGSRTLSWQREENKIKLTVPPETFSGYLNITISFE